LLIYFVSEKSVKGDSDENIHKQKKSIIKRNRKFYEKKEKNIKREG